MKGDVVSAKIKPPCYDAFKAALFEYERYQQTENGRFLFAAWADVRLARTLSPDDDSVAELFEKLCTQIDGIAAKLLEFKPESQRMDLTAIRSAVGFGGETGTLRSENARKKSEAAILARYGVAQRALGDLRNGFDLPGNIKTIANLDQLMADASGLSISAVRKIWDEWCAEYPQDAKAERELFARLSERKPALTDSLPTKQKANKTTKPKSWK